MLIVSNKVAFLFFFLLLVTFASSFLYVKAKRDNEDTENKVVLPHLDRNDKNDNQNVIHVPAKEEGGDASSEQYYNDEDATGPSTFSVRKYMYDNLRDTKTSALSGRREATKEGNNMQKGDSSTDISAFYAKWFEFMDSILEHQNTFEEFKPAVKLTHINDSVCEFLLQWASDVSVKDMKVLVDLSNRQLIVSYQHQTRDGENTQSKSATIKQEIDRSCVLNKNIVESGKAAYALKNEELQESDANAPVKMKIWFPVDESYVPPQEKSSERPGMYQTQSYEDIITKTTGGETSKQVTKFMRGPNMYMKSTSTKMSSSFGPSSTPATVNEATVNEKESNHVEIRPNLPLENVENSLDVIPLKKFTWKEEL